MRYYSYKELTQKTKDFVNIIYGLNIRSVAEEGISAQWIESEMNRLSNIIAEREGLTNVKWTVRALSLNRFFKITNNYSNINLYFSRKICYYIINDDNSVGCMDHWGRILEFLLKPWGEYKTLSEGYMKCALIAISDFYLQVKLYCSKHGGITI